MKNKSNNGPRIKQGDTPEGEAKNRDAKSSKGGESNNI